MKFATILLALIAGSTIYATSASADPDPRLRDQVCNHPAAHSPVVIVGSRDRFRIVSCANAVPPSSWGSLGDKDGDGILDNVDIDHLTGADQGLQGCTRQGGCDPTPDDDTEPTLP